MARNALFAAALLPLVGSVLASLGPISIGRGSTQSPTYTGTVTASKLAATSTANDSITTAGDIQVALGKNVYFDGATLACSIMDNTGQFVLTCPSGARVAGNFVAAGVTTIGNNNADYVTVTGGTAGNGTTFAAASSGSDSPLAINGKGAGAINFNGGAASIDSTGLVTGYATSMVHASTLSFGDGSGTPGSATINKPRGRFAIAVGAATATISNSEVAGANSTVLLVGGTTNAGCTRFDVTTVTTGSFTVTANANCTITAKVIDFVVIN